MGEPILSAGGRAVGDDNEVFVGLDVAKVRHAVAVAEDGRGGEVRSWERSTRIRRLFVVWSPVLRSVMHVCTSAMRPGRPSMDCIGS